VLHEKKLDEAIAASTTIQRRTWPTPIRVPKLVRNVLIVVAVVTVLTTLVFVAWRVPSALVIVVGASRSLRCSRHPCGTSRTSCRADQAGWRC
jgi:hypothetical protein